MNDLTAKSSSPNMSDPPLVSRRRRRRWLFRGLVLIAGWVAVELISWGLMGLLISGGTSEIKEFQDSLAWMSFNSRVPLDVATQTQTVHPYVGWVRNPEVLKSELYEGMELRTNRLGFLDTSEGIFHRDPHRLIVGVTGGSVAYQMSSAGSEKLQEVLRKHPDFQNREIVIVRMAQSAYKQPQGLYALNYFMLQGGEFDIVINLDGLNEVTMTVDQNFPQQVALDYPQGWKMRTGELIPPQESDIAGEILQLRGERHRRAAAACHSWFRYLPSQLLLWYSRDYRMRMRMIELEEIASQDDSQPSFIRGGPHPMARTESEAIDESVRIWKQASLQMHRLCQASGILYLHAIQPNQYDPGSKPLAPQELELMKYESPGNRNQNFLTIIPAAYPKLRQAGQELQAAGVQVLDLTGIFSNIQEELYVDSCCHVKPKGSEILATAIGEEILKMKSAR